MCKIPLVLATCSLTLTGSTGTYNQRSLDIAGQGPHFIVHFVVQHNYSVRIILYQLACFSECNLVVGAVKQTGIEVLFQLPDLECHRRLGYVQRLRSLGEAKQPGHGCKNLESPVSQCAMPGIRLLKDK
jgi:hypothetical protein